MGMCVTKVLTYVSITMKNLITDWRIHVHYLLRAVPGRWQGGGGGTALKLGLHFQF